MLHFEVELEVAYELSSRLHYIIYIIYQILLLFFFYLVCNFGNFSATSLLASSPGSNAGAGGKREPGIHCLRMRQKYNVNDVTSSCVTRL